MLWSRSCADQRSGTEVSARNVHQGSRSVAFPQRGQLRPLACTLAKGIQRELSRPS